MQRRFFVTIFAPNQEAFVALRRRNLDLFGPVAKPRGESSIGGLLNEADIEQVRAEGYRVEVHEEYVPQGRKPSKKAAGKLARRGAAAPEDVRAAPAPPVKTMDDKAWLEEFNRRKKVQ